MILVRDLLIAHVDPDADFSCECADPDFVRVAPCAALFFWGGEDFSPEAFALRPAWTEMEVAPATTISLTEFL
ncbi:hypothetical protein [Xanthomonas translucens]|uniref:hypothetical protein n=1 Tax=Xanthomonas campestris pv. translucens TaxID=343 RepID=UPI0027151987|nr:hypothetical protein [Xanthomonas translucens]WLA16413.1 hypothetical protein MO326_02180 [Xanthomonas translucens]